MDTCIFCGERQANTRDHIPPRSIFPKPAPSNLITVPACRVCNGNWSCLDEILKLFLSLQAGMEGLSEKALHDSVKRTVDHNKRLKRFLKQNAKKREVRTPNGIILGDVCEVAFPRKDINAMCRRIIAGLFYHHNKYRIPNDADLSVYLPEQINSELLAITRYCELEIIGGDREFIYRHGAANDHIYASAWVLLFYKRFLVVGFVIPKDKKSSKAIE